jgi:hypothetical protein
VNGHLVKRRQRGIAHQVDGRFSDMLELIKKAEEARLESERRLTKALAIVSARTGHPFTTIEALIRAEDQGLPPRRNATGQRRRKNDAKENL